MTSFKFDESYFTNTRKYVDFIVKKTSIEDYDDFIFTLQCLSKWSIEKFPHVVNDYIENNLQEDYSKVEQLCLDGELLSEYKDQLLNYTEYTNQKIGFMKIFLIDKNFKPIYCDLINSPSELNSYMFIKFIKSYDVMVKKDGNIINKNKYGKCNINITFDFLSSFTYNISILDYKNIMYDTFNVNITYYFDFKIILCMLFLIGLLYKTI